MTTRELQIKGKALIPENSAPCYSQLGSPATDREVLSSHGVCRWLSPKGTAYPPSPALFMAFVPSSLPSCILSPSCYSGVGCPDSSGESLCLWVPVARIFFFQFPQSNTKCILPQTFIWSHELWELVTNFPRSSHSEWAWLYPSAAHIPTLLSSCESCQQHQAAITTSTLEPLLSTLARGFLSNDHPVGRAVLNRG